MTHCCSDEGSSQSGRICVMGKRCMADDAPISRQSFNEAIARLGIEGSEGHLEELYRQVQGVLTGTRSLQNIDVSGVEPDMAFSPSGSQRS